MTADEYVEHCRTVHDRKEGTHAKSCKQTQGMEADVLSFFVHLEKPADQRTAWTAPVTPAMRRLFTLPTEEKAKPKEITAHSGRGSEARMKLYLHQKKKLQAIQEGEN